MMNAANRLRTLVNAMRTRGPDVVQLLEEVDACAKTKAGFDTGVLFFNNTGEAAISRRPWIDFCTYHEINGERFKEVMDPILDLQTPITTGSAPTTLRDIYEAAGLQAVIDFIVGDADGDDVQYTPLKVWLMIAHFLALHEDKPVPEWMK